MLFNFAGIVNKYFTLILNLSFYLREMMDFFPLVINHNFFFFKHSILTKRSSIFICKQWLVKGLKVNSEVERWNRFPGSLRLSWVVMAVLPSYYPWEGRVVCRVLPVDPSWENNSVISIRKMIYWGQFLFRIGQENHPCNLMMLISSAKPFNDEVVGITLALNWITGTSRIPSVIFSGNTKVTTASSWFGVVEKQGMYLSGFS